jgi:hypothetical protein
VRIFNAAFYDFISSFTISFLFWPQSLYPYRKRSK